MSDIATKNYPASAKVLVKGKNQSRTALGIANAYLLIHPDATVADLNEAFPSDKLGLGKFKMFLDEQGVPSLWQTSRLMPPTKTRKRVLNQTISTRTITLH